MKRTLPLIAVMLLMGAALRGKGDMLLFPRIRGTEG